MWVDTLHSFYILTSPAVVRLLCQNKKKKPSYSCWKTRYDRWYQFSLPVCIYKKIMKQKPKRVYNMGYQLTRICESLSLVNRFMHTVKKNLIFLSYINQ